MAVVEEPDFAALLGAEVEEAADDPLIVRAAAVAKAKIDGWIAEGTNVPVEVYTEAILRAGSSIYYRRTARNGIVSFGEAGGETTAMRIPRDDFNEARTLLADYIGWGIG